jgi:fatty-acyl-CoA synthase
MYVGDYLARRCMYTPRHVAVTDTTVDPELRLTYADLDQRANQLASWLRGRGVGKGDRVAMLAHDGVHFYDAFFACGKLGAVFVPLSFRLHAREIAALVGQVTPMLLFYETELLALVEGLERMSPTPELMPLTGIEGILSEATPPVTCEGLTERDTACLLFTGGTTGLPKAAQVSHGQIVWNAFNSHLADVRASDVYLNIFPLFHTGGLFAFTLPILILGGTVVQTGRFEPDRVLELIDREQATILAGVPTMFQMLCESSRWAEASLGTLRFCMSGGAPMPVPLIERYQREKGVVFRQGFGMTEFGPSVFSLASDDAVQKAGSIGKPNFFVDARVVDAKNQPVPPGQVGELVLRGPVATTGYHGDAEATRAAFDEHGYFHTGDLARIDDEGYFYIVDRLKDMFVSGGENVYPVEIEAALYQHPAVAMCAVIGVPDPQWGEVGLAFVVLQQDDETSADALLEHLRERLARYKVPREIRLVDDLPMSGAGKVLKTALRDQVNQPVTPSGASRPGAMKP